MDRQIIYPGQLLPETSLLQMTKDSMIGAAKLASAILGTSTVASGFAVTPTGPASLQVLCAPGEIYSMAAIDALAFSTLPADTTHSILKQGILLDGVALSCPAPVTTAQSINYLVQVTYQDADSTPVLLPYYNSANPSLPYSGIGNNGLTQNTVRKGAAIVSVKAGVSAATGTQVTPTPDAGNIGLYAVTVAFGQTTITAGSIAVLATAPLINSTLHGVTPVFSVPVAVSAATSAAHSVPLSQAQLMFSPPIGTATNLKMTVATASASATVTADEIIVGTALGAQTYRIASYSKVINLASTGAGGMDTGTSPVSGWVALYAIYNPTTQTQGILAVNSPNTVMPAVYGGANMPAGYTASALLTVVPTNASSQLKICTVRARKVYIQLGTVFSGSSIVTNNPVSITGIIPANAIEVSGELTVGSTALSSLSLTINPDSGFTGQQSVTTTVGAGQALTLNYTGLPVTTTQQLMFTSSSTAGTATFNIYIASYSI
jgi:hypothetical protein